MKFWSPSRTVSKTWGWGFYSGNTCYRPVMHVDWRPLDVFWLKYSWHFRRVTLLKCACHRKRHDWHFNSNTKQSWTQCWWRWWEILGYFGTMKLLVVLMFSHSRCWLLLNVKMLLWVKPNQTRTTTMKYTKTKRALNSSQNCEWSTG